MRFRQRCFAIALVVFASTQHALSQPADQQPVAPAQPPPPLPAAPPPAEPPPPPADAQPLTEPAGAQPPPSNEGLSATAMDIYGFAMLDIGYDFGDIGDPRWEDVIRPTKLPSFENEFGKGGRTFASARQSRLGVSTKTPTSHGDLTTKFEFEMFGVGVDEGQTTFRLRHAYGQWRGIRAGQTWSPFMDPDVFPDSIEYWGPTGMAFYRNVHLAYIPYEEGNTNVTIALERPGASADTGTYAERLELDGVVARFPAPDLSAAGKYAGDWGHVKLAGILRYIVWEDLSAMGPTVEGDAIGWGVNLSSNIKAGPALLKLQAVYGHAIQNYMNDGGPDIGAVASGDPANPIDGEALPLLGLVAFADIAWNSTFTSSVGWSYVWIKNSEMQTPEAFHQAHYALANLLFKPTKSLMFGPELQYGRRSNNDGDFSSDDFRIQFSAKYSFSQSIGGP